MSATVDSIALFKLDVYVSEVRDVFCISSVGTESAAVRTVRKTLEKALVFWVLPNRLRLLFKCGLCSKLMPNAAHSLIRGDVHVCPQAPATADFTVNGS